MRVVAECRIQILGDSKNGLTLNSTIEKSKKSLWFKNKLSGNMYAVFSAQALLIQQINLSAVFRYIKNTGLS
jgi:hypothetical protein